VVAEKPRDAAVNFDIYRNLKRHRAALPAIAWLLLNYGELSIVISNIIIKSYIIHNLLKCVFDDVTETAGYGIQQVQWSFSIDLFIDRRQSKLTASSHTS